MVDPIDGTLNFVHGMRYWCVSIAYVERGVRQRRPRSTIPSLDELFSACRGEWRALQWRPDPRLDLRVARPRVDIAGLRAPARSRHASRASAALLLAAGAAVKDPGAGALMLAHVAAGRFDAFYEPHMHPWDALAGLLLVEEAGGRVLLIRGRRGLPAGGAVLASAPALYDRLLALVRTSVARP